MNKKTNGQDMPRTEAGAQLAGNGIGRSPRAVVRLGAEADRNTMEANMNEHRNSLDQNVEQRVEQEAGQPERLITPLETCKALSDRIGREIAAMKDELARVKV